MSLACTHRGFLKYGVQDDTSEVAAGAASGDDASAGKNWFTDPIVDPEYAGGKVYLQYESQGN